MVEVTERERVAFEAALNGLGVRFDCATRVGVFEAADHLMASMAQSESPRVAVAVALAEATMGDGVISAEIEPLTTHPKIPLAFTRQLDALLQRACFDGIGLVIVVAAADELFSLGKACEHSSPITRQIVPRLLLAFRRVMAGSTTALAAPLGQPNAVIKVH